MKKNLKLCATLLGVIALVACQNKTSHEQVEYRTVEPSPNIIVADSYAPQDKNLTLVEDNLSLITSLPSSDTIVRDAMGKPNYKKIEHLRGSFARKTYKVQKGDTWFLLKFLSGKSIKELQRLNKMTELKTGVTVRL